MDEFQPQLRVFRIACSDLRPERSYIILKGFHVRIPLLEEFDMLLELSLNSSNVELLSDVDQGLKIILNLVYRFTWLGSHSQEGFELKDLWR